jgi:hypothetical protein
VHLDIDNFRKKYVREPRLVVVWDNIYSTVFVPCHCLVFVTVHSLFSPSLMVPTQSCEKDCVYVLIEPTWVPSVKGWFSTTLVCVLSRFNMPRIAAIVIGFTFPALAMKLVSNSSRYNGDSSVIFSPNLAAWLAGGEEATAE